VDEGDFKIERKRVPGPFAAPVDHALPFCDIPALHNNPSRGEKSPAALGRQTGLRTDLPVEAVIEEMTEMPTIPNDWTPEQEKTALAKVKEVDPKGEQDLIFTGIRKGGFALFFVRARKGKPNQQTGFRAVADQRLMWLPAAASGSLADFVTYFAVKYGDGDEKAGETVFRKKALDAELVTIRSKMKAKPGTGKRRGKTLV